MTFDEATALAMAGKTVKRAKWRNFAVSSRPGGKHQRLVYVNDFDDAGDLYKPKYDDKTATDWMERP